MIWWKCVSQLHGSSLNVTPNNLSSPFLSISFMGAGIGFLVFPLTMHRFPRLFEVQGHTILNSPALDILRLA